MSAATDPAVPRVLRGRVPRPPGLVPRSEPRYARHGDDFYVEPAWFVQRLLDVERFEGTSWDPAAGTGTIPRMFRAHGLECHASDIVDRGFPRVEVADFLATERRVDNVVSNPPFRLIGPFVKHALACARSKVAIIARLNLLETTGRDWLLGAGPGDYPTPLAHVWISRRRVNMPPGDSGSPAEGGKHAYAWFIWEHGWQGPAVLGRI